MVNAKGGDAVLVVQTIMGRVSVFRIFYFDRQFVVRPEFLADDLLEVDYDVYVVHKKGVDRDGPVSGVNVNKIVETYRTFRSSI